MRLQNPEFVFSPPQGEAEGYMRRFSIGERTGVLIFRFHGDRDDRICYLMTEIYAQPHKNVAHISGNPGDLVDVMQDGEDLTWAIMLSKFVEQLPPTTKVLGG